MNFEYYPRGVCSRKMTFDVENGVVIDEQGAASVKNLNVGKLVQTDGDWLILNGGNSTLTVE